MSQVAVADEKDKQFHMMLQNSKGQIAAALPKHMDPDRMLRVALTCFRTNPLLKNCAPASIIKCFVESSQLGLEPGVQGQAYLVPFGSECTLIPGYRGLLKLARQSDEIALIDAYTVYEGDEFDVELGSTPRLVHKPKFQSENATHYYAICRLKTGDFQFVIKSKEQIEKHRDRYSKQPKGSAWGSSFDEMALKTCLRNLCKRIPQSIELIQALAHEQQTIEADFFDADTAKDTREKILNAPNTPVPGEEEAIREKFRALVKEAVKAKIDTTTLYKTPDEALETYDTKKLHAMNVILEQKLEKLKAANP